MGAIRNMRAIRPKNTIVILEDFHGVVVYTIIYATQLVYEFVLKFSRNSSKVMCFLIKDMHLFCNSTDPNF